MGVVVRPLLAHLGHGHGDGRVLAWLCGGGLVRNLVRNGLPHDSCGIVNGSLAESVCGSSCGAYQ